jgi:hypothetical protein
MSSPPPTRRSGAKREAKTAALALIGGAGPKLKTAKKLPELRLAQKEDVDKLADTNPQIVAMFMFKVC